MSTKRKLVSKGSVDARAYLEKLNGGPLTVGQALNSHRLCEEITMADMARTLGVSRSTLNDIEKGRRRVSPQKAAEFGKALGDFPGLWALMAIREQLRDAGLDKWIKVEAA
jgi:plasmid maintenance system antidote protein VapI